MAITLKDLKGSACASLNPHLFEPPVKKREKNPGKQKPWIEFQLKQWAQKNNITLSTEFKFHPERKWRFDWCFEDLKIAIEYEGIFSAKSRHTTHTGFTGDINKYNAAQQSGWTVLRYTALNYLDLINDLVRIENDG